YRLADWEADALDTPFPELSPNPDAVPAAATSSSLDSLGELP
ncbi:MAG TPA: P-type conjugative transfer ATPase TrbB, partial [Steroidobacteraceae bacterium]